MDSEATPESPQDTDPSPFTETWNPPGVDAPSAPPVSPVRLKWGYWDILWLLLFAIPAYLLSTLVCIAAFELYRLATGSEIAAMEFLSQTSVVVVAQLLWSVLLLGFIYGIVSLKYGLPFATGIAWRKPDRPPAIYLFWGILMAISVAGLSQLLPTPTGRMPIEDLLKDRASVIVLSIFGVLFAPAIEELIFRGFIYPVVERSNGTIGAVLVTSVIFALPHAVQYGWRWQNLLLLTYVGIIFGTVRARTRSIIPTTLLHAAYNATLFAGLLAAGDKIFQP